MWEDKTDGHSEIRLSTLPIWREGDLSSNCSVGVETQSNRPATDHTLEGEVGNSLNPSYAMRWMYELVSARFDGGLHGWLALGPCPEFDALEEVPRRIFRYIKGPERTTKRLRRGTNCSYSRKIDRSLCLLGKPSNRVKPVVASRSVIPTSTMRFSPF